jgi:hypothetical protein
MIERALGHNQHPGRVNYYLNTSTHLRPFPDGQFDLVYSVISLQHIPRLSPDCRISEGALPNHTSGGVIFSTPGQLAEVSIQVLLVSAYLLEKAKAYISDKNGDSAQNDDEFT